MNDVKNNEEQKKQDFSEKERETFSHFSAAAACRSLTESAYSFHSAWCFAIHLFFFNLGDHFYFYL